MIAHFMLDPIKSSPRKLHHAAENFKQVEKFKQLQGAEKLDFTDFFQNFSSYLFLPKLTLHVVYARN
jgi:hypothetical protein